MKSLSFNRQCDVWSPRHKRYEIYIHIFLGPLLALPSGIYNSLDAAKPSFGIQDTTDNTKKKKNSTIHRMNHHLAVLNPLIGKSCTNRPPIVQQVFLIILLPSCSVRVPVRIRIRVRRSWSECYLFDCDS